MNVALIIQPGFPPAKIRRWAAQVKPDTTVWLFDGLKHGAEYLTVEFALRSRKIDVRTVAEPGHAPLEGVVVMRDRHAQVVAEQKARAKGIPVVVIEARVW